MFLVSSLLLPRIERNRECEREILAGVLFVVVFFHALPCVIYIGGGFVNFIAPVLGMRF